MRKHLNESLLDRMLREIYSAIPVKAFILDKEKFKRATIDYQHSIAAINASSSMSGMKNITGIRKKDHSPLKSNSFYCSCDRSNIITCSYTNQ